jgi:hypothetical protein
MKCALFSGPRKSELLSMERLPWPLVTDHARSRENDVVDFRNQTFGRHSPTWRNIYEPTVNIWPQRAALSSALRAFSKDKAVGKTSAPMEANGLKYRSHPQSLEAYAT